MTMYNTEPESNDPGRLRDEQPHEDPPICDSCGNTGVHISVAGLGIFCSHACANAESLHHEAVMSRRRA